MRHRLAALALAASLFAGPALAARDTLTIGISQFPANWHPSIEAMAAKHFILDATRRPFTTYDAGWTLTCLLCTALPSVGRILSDLTAGTFDGVTYDRDLPARVAGSLY